MDLYTVTISQTEYQRLVDEAHCLEKLKQSLLEGGLSQETLDVLIHGREKGPESPLVDVPEERLNRRQVNGLPATLLARASHHPEAWKENGTDTEYTHDCTMSSESGSSSQEQNCRRTVLLQDLPRHTTYKDIVKVVRGGAILYVSLQEAEHFALVSFVNHSAASEFLRYAQKYGIHLKGKRLLVSWNERQFFLSPRIKSNVSRGATRNIVIYNVNPRVTEKMIRKHLEHIHNLVVIYVEFKHGNAYISTNSIYHALFARLCMTSQLEYRAKRLGFFADECARTLPNICTVPKGIAMRSTTRSFVDQNRFELLSLGDLSEDEDD